MKVIILAVLVALAAGAPVDDGGVDISPSENVNVIVNGVPEGEALEIAHLLDIELNEHSDGAVATSNLLQPLSAAAIAEAAAELVPEPVALPEAAIPEVVLPEPVVLPEAATPEVVIPEPVVLPEAATPEVVIPEPVVLPEAATPEVVESGIFEVPAADAEAGIVPVAIPELVVPGATPELVIPGEVVLPEPATPEVVVPEAADTPVSGDFYNDGVVQVIVNTPEEPTILSTLSSWMSLAISYVTGGVQTTNQIV